MTFPVVDTACVPSPLQHIADLCRLQGGSNAAVWRAGDVVFRCSVETAASLQAAERTFHVSLMLQRQGVRVPSPVAQPFVADGWLIETQEALNAVATNPVEAGSLLGLTTRALHDADIGEPPTPLDLDAIAVSVEQVDDPLVDLELQGIVRAAIQVCAPAASRFGMSVVHGDLWPKNVMFVADSAALVDLDGVHVGHRLHDLALVTLGPFYVRDGVAQPPVVLDAFERAYSEELPSVAEAAAYVIAREAHGLADMKARGKSLHGRVARIKNQARLLA